MIVEDTNGANRQSADAFRCESFLRVVREVRGNVRHQYQGDELIGKRFEQCPSEDVLADTIVEGKLPGTGGPPLMLMLGLAGVALGAAVGIVVLRRSEPPPEASAPADAGGEAQEATERPDSEARRSWWRRMFG